MGDDNLQDHIPMLVDDEEQAIDSALNDRNVYYPDNLGDLMNALELVTPKNNRNEGPSLIPEFGLPPSARGADYLRQETVSSSTEPRGVEASPEHRPIDLSAISRSPLHIPVDLQEFHLSMQLQHDLSLGRSAAAARGRSAAVVVEELLQRVFDETEEFARRKKEAVREALKERQDVYANVLTSNQKKQLRNRREAKVTRVKDQAVESAVRSVLKWMIANADIRHPENCPCRGGDVMRVQ